MIAEVWNCSVSLHTDCRCEIKLTSLISTFYIEIFFFGCVCDMLINDGVVFLYFILVVLCEKKKKRKFPPLVYPFIHCFYSALMNLVLPGLNIDITYIFKFSPLCKPWLASIKPVKTLQTGCKKRSRSLFLFFSNRMNGIYGSCFLWRKLTRKILSGNEQQKTNTNVNVGLRKNTYVICPNSENCCETDRLGSWCVFVCQMPFFHFIHLLAMLSFPVHSLWPVMPRGYQE